MIDTKQPYLQVDSINKSFGRSRVLHDISFSVMQNQVAIVRGMNGSGNFISADDMEGSDGVNNKGDDNGGN